MARIYETAYYDDDILPLNKATLSIASSAVLYGLSVYTVFPVNVSKTGELLVFRLHDHYQRLINSARIMGIDTFETAWSEQQFVRAVNELLKANRPSSGVFVRATVHVNEQLPGPRSRGLKTILSMFVYEALPILPQDGARLKTTTWQRIADNAIPSRAKVNGAYVNSVLGKQDALDCGYDDCIFLDAAGHVCELSAANIFIVRNNTLITPCNTSDVLEGINRQTIIDVATNLGFRVAERTIDLTELYIADEVFACGTSAYIAPIIEIDARMIGAGVPGPITLKLRQEYTAVLQGVNPNYSSLLTAIT